MTSQYVVRAAGASAGAIASEGIASEGIASPDEVTVALVSLDEITANPGSLHAVLGGFHLNGPLFEPLIPIVLDVLSALAPNVVLPAHCTGWRAQHAMGARYGEAFIPNSAGTRFEL